MVNTRLAQLPEYPFPRLRALIAGIDAPAGLDPISMSIGEPRHAFPDFIRPILDENRRLYTNYPPAKGTPEFRRAIKSWLDRRYGLPSGMIDEEDNIAPVCGTREALFNIGLITLNTLSDTVLSSGKPPVALIPNPFYQAYAAAVAAAGGEAVFLPALPENGFLPDFEAVDEATWARVQLVYLCSPANPQGAVAGPDYLTALIARARAADFVIAIDECYTEIYDRTPPTGILQVCAAMAGEAAGTPGGALKNVLAFHSLSKRSNVPGLRSGFMAGDPELVALYLRLKEFGGSVIPGPVLAASTALWGEETHVEENRRLYRRKFDMAESIIGNRFDFYRPAAGFFLWLNVGDGEAAAKKIWTEAGVLVLPGKYLSAPAPGPDPGGDYIRLALVADIQETEAGLRRVTAVLD